MQITRERQHDRSRGDGLVLHIPAGRSVEANQATRIHIGGTHERKISKPSPPASRPSATALAAFAATLSETEWETRVPTTDGRSASWCITWPAICRSSFTSRSYSPPATQSPIVAWDAVHAMNRAHAAKHDDVTKEATLALLAQSSAAAAAAIRALSETELDRAAPVSLNGDAPLTCQFMLEDHAVRPQLPPPRPDPISARALAGWPVSGRSTGIWRGSGKARGD